MVGLFIEVKEVVSCSQQTDQWLLEALVNGYAKLVKNNICTATKNFTYL